MAKKLDRKNQRKTEQALTDEQGPFWQHAYRDWRVLLGVFLATVFLVTYLMTGDFHWHPKGSWGQSVETTDNHGTDLPPVTADPQIILPKSTTSRSGGK